jgi:AT-rich interactive domain-containing protein 1
LKIVIFPVRSEDQVMREFAINLLYYLSQADSGVARTIALQVL